MACGRRQDQTMGDVVWSLDQSVAQLKTGHLELQLNVARPQQGLGQVRCGGHDWLADLLLGITIPGMESDDPVAVDESYIRGSDLIVRYAATASERFSPQVHWCYQELDRAFGVEVMISMQTDLLDSRPMVETKSAFAAGQLLCAGEVEGFCEATESGPTERSTPLLVFRPSEARFSYVQMAYPSDVVGFWTRPGESYERSEAGFRLLHQHLEKGVIRRLRVAAWFVPREADCQCAWDLFQRLVQSAPPLTT